jgi:hypothetical protein
MRRLVQGKTMTIDAPPPQTPQQKAMVRVLLVAITLMTLAIVGILAAMVARFLSPGQASPPPSGGAAIDFAAAPVVAITLPSGVRVVETHVDADRATFVVETDAGERAIYTTPLEGRGPVRLQFK